MEDFGKLLEESWKSRKKIQEGSSFIARILQVSGDYYFIETENKIRGVLLREEFAFDNEPKVGDSLEVHFLREESGDYYFTHTLSHENIHFQNLQIAKEHSIPVWGQFAQKIQDGYQVRVGNLSAFCPNSQLTGDLETSNLIGKRAKFIVTNLDGKRIVLSQKKFKELEYNKKIEQFKEDWKVGLVLSCKILEIQPNGLRVDVNGVKGFIPTSEASRKASPQLENEYKIGQTIPARILELDWDKKKLILTCKEFLDDPWVSQLHWKPGDITEGVIEKLKQYGIFVQLDKNFTGLVPWKEAGMTKNNPGLSYWEKIYKPGDTVKVSIVSIDPEKRQITLSIQKAKEHEERQDYEKFLAKEEDIQAHGTFGDFLKKSMQKQKK